MTDHEEMEQPAEETPATHQPPKRFLFTKTTVELIFVEGAEDAVQAYEAALETWRHSADKTGITVRTHTEHEGIQPKPYSSEIPQLGFDQGAPALMRGRL